jgi:hypothetical protein
VKLALELTARLPKDATWLDSWATFNDASEPKYGFEPYMSSGNSYVFVYRRTNAPAAKFSPTVPPANLERIREILKVFPTSKRGRLEVSHTYNTSGAASRRPASMHAVANVRNRLMAEIREVQRTLNSHSEDTERRLRRMEDTLSALVKGQEQVQGGMTQILDWINEQKVWSGFQVS